MKRRTMFIAGAIAGALVTGGSVAIATSNVIGGGGVINACYRVAEDDRKGEVRVVNDPTSCRQNELPIAWNVQGTKGDQGPRGDQGPQGDRGPAGVTNWRVVGAQSANNSDGHKFVHAECPEGQRVLGGGGRVVPASGGEESLGRVFLTTGQPVFNSFFAEAREVAGGTQASWVLFAYAVCADVS